MFKGKKMSKVWWLVLLLALVVATALVALYLTQKTSAPDSTVDSETSMVPKTDATKFKEQYPKVVDNNKFVYSTDQEVMSIFDNGTGLVFLGFTECPWCQQLAPIVDEAARAEGLEKIYYLNIREARESNSPVYQALVDKLKDYLQKDEDGNPRIYVPDVTVFKDGEVAGRFKQEPAAEGEIVKADTYWTEGRHTRAVEQLRDMIRQIK